MSDHKIAIVTGGSRGIGRDAVVRLARRGVRTIFTYNSNRAEADKVVALAADAGAQAVALQLDVGDASTFAGFAEAVRERLAAWGAERFDYLVNNAGTIYREPAEDHDVQAWMTVVQVNLNSVFRLSQLAGRSMLEQRQGKIINIASIAGLAGLGRATISTPPPRAPS